MLKRPSHHSNARSCMLPAQGEGASPEQLSTDCAPAAAVVELAGQRVHAGRGAAAFARWE